jgi:hypothetical protein
MATKKPEIQYHVGHGKTPWREAVLSVPIGASTETIEQMAETVTRLGEAFPVPVTDGINEWYIPSFVRAYIVVSTPVRMQAMLVAMAEAGAANPGEVILNWGSKHPTDTIATVAETDADYLEWVRKQAGAEAVRIAVAFDAYRATKKEA